MFFYYRIKEIDMSGSYTYSQTVSVQIVGPAGALSVFPNPAKGPVTVRFSAATGNVVNLRLFDERGSLVWQQQKQASAGQNYTQIDNINSLPNGIYFLQSFDKQQSQQVKVLVNH